MQQLQSVPKRLPQPLLKQETQNKKKMRTLRDDTRSCDSFVSVEEMQVLVRVMTEREAGRTDQRIRNLENGKVCGAEKLLHRTKTTKM